MLQGEGKENDKRKEFVLSICLQLLLYLVKSVARPGDFSGVTLPSTPWFVFLPVASRWCWALLMEGQEKLPAPSL